MASTYTSHHTRPSPTTQTHNLNNPATPVIAEQEAQNPAYLKTRPNRPIPPPNFHRNTANSTARLIPITRLHPVIISNPVNTELVALRAPRTVPIDVSDADISIEHVEASLCARGRVCSAACEDVEGPARSCPERVDVGDRDFGALVVFFVKFTPDNVLGERSESWCQDG